MKKLERIIMTSLIAIGFAGAFIGASVNKNWLMYPGAGTVIVSVFCYSYKEDKEKYRKH